MLRAFFLLLFSLWLGPAHASDLSFEEADSILQDTYTIVGYIGLFGEKDYGDPQNVIRAALFGAFDAMMEYELDLNRRTAEGEEPLEPNFPLFTVEGRAFTSQMTVSRDAAPKLFAGKPDQYTTFISREAVEIAALRFTGHAIKEHRAPVSTDILGDTLLTKEGYFVSIDGLGGLPNEVVLKSLVPDGNNGYVLEGDVVLVMGDDSAASPGHFTLHIAPGEKSGTWLRSYSETGTP